jgi:hypothetical protein
MNTMFVSFFLSTKMFVSFDIDESFLFFLSRENDYLFNFLKAKEIISKII